MIAQENAAAVERAIAVARLHHGREDTTFLARSWKKMRLKLTQRSRDHDSPVRSIRPTRPLAASFGDAGREMADGVDRSSAGDVAWGPPGMLRHVWIDREPTVSPADPDPRLDISCHIPPSLTVQTHPHLCHLIESSNTADVTPDSRPYDCSGSPLFDHSIYGEFQT